MYLCGIKFFNKMKHAYFTLLFVAVTLIVAGCNSGKSSSTSATATSRTQTMKARAYRTNNRDYINNVWVRLSDDGKSVVWRPEANAVDSATAPVKIRNGYAIDRWDISPEVVFTKWTYEQYGKMAKTPSDLQIINAVVPGVYVSEIVELPMGQFNALMHPAAVDSLLLADPSSKRVIFKK